MKRVLSCGAFAALAMMVMGATQAAAQAAAPAGPLKIGYVNSQRVLAEAPAAVQAQRALETDMARYKAQADSLGRAIEAARAAYQREQPTLTPAVRTQRETALQQRFEAYQQQVAQIEQTAQRRQSEVVDPVMKQINGVIDQMRTEGGYTLILDSSTGVMLSADPALDMTAQVLTRLRGAAPAAPASH
ncbi:MAG TPA: OmpH family outer membrane protein [Longimicrobiaceae bacterium]|jgi:outer membrane protein|nr:OmpH family outer membrane protein [Longimicrobiaceae bacterium]